jgi:hypothetical protein
MATSGDIKAGRAYVELYADRAKLTGNLDEARAQVNRWQAEMARAQTNAAKAGAAGDTGAAAQQSQRASAASERLATAQQEAAGRSELAQRLANFKALRVETAPMADGMERVADTSGRTADNLGLMEKRAARYLKIFLGIKVATAAMQIATAALNDEWENVGETLKSLPIVGGGGTTGFHLGKALARNLDEKLHPEKGVEEAKARGLGEATSGKMNLEQIAAESARRVRIAGMSEEEKALFLLEEERQAAIVKIKDLGKAEERLLTGKPQEAKALAAINSEYDKRAAKIKQKTEDAHEADVIAATKEREDKEEREQRAREASAAAEKRAADAEEAAATAEREPRNAEYNAVLKEAEQRGEVDRRGKVKSRQDDLMKGLQDAADEQDRIWDNQEARANKAWDAAEAAEKIADKMTPRGTMSGSTAAIQSLQTGPAFDALTKASQETAKNTRALVEGGLAQFK